MKFEYGMSIKYRTDVDDLDSIGRTKSSITMMSDDTVITLRGSGIDLTIPLRRVAVLEIARDQDA